MNVSMLHRRLTSHAEAGFASMQEFLAAPGNQAEIETALRIRAVETALFSLFGKGKLHGTIHTCVGQEFSGVLAGKNLRQGDFVFSNHRCHGHFIAATQNWRGLVDELIGNKDGVCAGIGSSQHLWGENFISNGPQGALLPVAAGLALDRKLAGTDNVAVSFIGEGTLGEGLVYETFNLDALWDLPHLVICENNFYSQSTPQDVGVAGDITRRAEAFGIRAFETDTWDLAHLDETMGAAFEYVRGGRPAFLVIRTYRLNPHSKGDDQRDSAELQWFGERDPLNFILATSESHQKRFSEIEAEVEAYCEIALKKPLLDAANYFPDQIPRTTAELSAQWRPAAKPVSEQRGNQQINEFYKDWFQRDDKAVMLGEDIADPYGGAFKVTKGLSTQFGARIRTTPISEAAITGAGIGLALSGRRAVVEIMFGDFVTYAFDQLVSNASKFFHMYHRHVSSPVVVRMPMGGRRGYGPTHSQSLERFLVGIDNCCTLSLSSMIDVQPQLAPLEGLAGPAVVVENKIDYTLKTFWTPEGFILETNSAPFPTIRLRPADTTSNLTIITYGGMARYVADHVMDIFDRADVVPEILALTAIHPIDMEAIIESARRTGQVLIVEEGPSFASPGAEIAAGIATAGGGARIVRLGGKPVPIPSVPTLEAKALPAIDDICAAIASLSGHGT